MDWKTVLPKGLELLGGALTLTGVGAPVGAGLSGLGTLLAHTLGTEHTEAAVSAALQSLTPEAQAKLIELQENNKVALQQIQLQRDLARLAAASARQQAGFNDTLSARQRDISIIQAGKAAGQNWRADAMLLGAYLTVMVIVVVFFLAKISAESGIGVFLVMAGTKLLSNIGTAFDFEFGSSRSSKDKDATLLAAAAKAPG